MESLQLNPHKKLKLDDTDSPNSRESSKLLYPLIFLSNSLPLNYILDSSLVAFDNNEPKFIHGNDVELNSSNSKDEFSFKIVENDDSIDSLIFLTGLKNIFQRQLPKMPKEYIAKLVYDKNHCSLAIVKNNFDIIGGITYRSFEERSFIEIVFCAVSSSEQVKGFGSKMMNYLKDYILENTVATTFLTYADNYAIGYFKKQGFTKEITFDKRLWIGYIKDYEGGTLMQCTMVPRVKYSESKLILTIQRQAVLNKIKSISKSHIVYKGLVDLKKSDFPIDPYSIPGVAESDWVHEMDFIGQSDTRTKLHTWQSNVVSEMQVNPSSWAFLQPVDTKEVPDYTTHIKNPMDLATLEANVEANKYENLESFVSDVMLIFSNAREYNGESSRYGRCATNLQRFFEQRLSDYKTKSSLNQK
ncbi:Histone acetyltransferase GCN5 [Smittium culicis]|uniref:histone acetyltransferase n=1 Tax=Smittium culicis TaxID=133412 RepID=A0A1R1XTE6_9FUNG|nr:Histone acetyltransferase GCN5 [Smittium culicis]